MHIWLAKYEIFLDKPGLYPFATPKFVYIKKDCPLATTRSHIISVLAQKGPKIMHI